MKVNELKDKTKVDVITLKVKSKEEPREVRNGLRLCNLIGEDDTGKVTVTLWNDDVDKVKAGDTIKITGGWCAVYQDNMQVSAGKFGTIEVVE
ncbi:MAG: OB-fold nucleic acid binding domain-containing protein [archaeon]